MIRFFKSLQPAALFAIPILALMLWFPGFFKEDFFPGPDEDVIAGFLINWIGLLPRFLQVLICIVVISFSAVYLNLVMNRHEVLYKSTYLPSFLYVLLMSYHKDAISLHPMLFSNLVLIASLDRIFSLFKNESPVSPIVDGFLLLSVASFFHFPVVILFFLFLYALYTLRPFNLREWMIAIILFLLPYYFLSVYAFWTDSLLAGIQDLSSRVAFHRITFSLNDAMLLLFFSEFLLMLIVFALFRLRTNFYKNSIKTRSAQKILVAFCLFSLIQILFEWEIFLFHFTQLAIPFSIFLGYWYLSAGKRIWLYEISLWLMLAGIVINHF